MELALVEIVAQLKRRRLDGADGADEILKDLARGIVLQFVILAAVRHVVSVGGKQDQIVCLAHVDAFDDLAAKRLARGGILQFRLAQRLQEAVLVTVGHLLCRKHHVNEVFAQRAGERFF